MTKYRIIQFKDGSIKAQEHEIDGWKFIKQFHGHNDYTSLVDILFGTVESAEKYIRENLIIEEPIVLKEFEA